MTSSIVDNNGFLVFTGNDFDSKFSTVLARAEHIRVDVNVPNFEKPKWDGSVWVEGETDLEVWEKKMAESDGSLMPRYLEDLITTNSLTMTPEMKVRYDKKIVIRGERP